MQDAWGKKNVFLGLLAALAACSGLEPTPPEQEPKANAGGSGAFVHGSAACGNLPGASGGGGAPSSAGGAKSSLPSDFGAGGSSETSSSGGKGGAVSTAGTGAIEPGGSAGADGAAEPDLGHALLFTEYVEGSSNYKALEITALEDATLDGCKIAVYFNGATNASGPALEGVLLAGESTVVCSNALASLGAFCPRTAGLSFNGDDAVVLECDGVVIDAIGQVGIDPGTAWGSDDTSTMDHTLRRRCGALPDTDPTDAFEPSQAWLGFPQDSFEDLGRYDCSSDGAAGASGDG
jgi:hypothetical protein